MKNKKFLVLSSPSGGGKTTVAKYLMDLFPSISFSISATTRNKRPNEIDGKDYYFLSKAEFQSKIDKNELIEYEEIFSNYYGTLVSELVRAKDNGQILLFDIDVKGAFSIKKYFPEEALLIFLAPPDYKILEQRLRDRNTESEEQLQKRMERVKSEMEQADMFDYVIVNDVLDNTLQSVKKIMENDFFN
ncbi:MAG TPA: guanylate kinase [Candidatus Kapabacteria bacterium]|nr:guanylate kinase [Candidatus Kapabacteria bacterium]